MTARYCFILQCVLGLAWSAAIPYGGYDELSISSEEDSFLSWHPFAKFMRIPFDFDDKSENLDSYDFDDSEESRTDDFSESSLFLFESTSEDRSSSEDFDEDSDYEYESDDEDDSDDEDYSDDGDDSYHEDDEYRRLNVLSLEDRPLLHIKLGSPEKYGLFSDDDFPRRDSFSSDNDYGQDSDDDKKFRIDDSDVYDRYDNKWDRSSSGDLGGIRYIAGDVPDYSGSSDDWINDDDDDSFFLF